MKDDPAYPTEMKVTGGQLAPSGFPGLSKRELIAAMMAQGMLGNVNVLKNLDIGKEGKTMPTMAVTIADALLRELDG